MKTTKIALLSALSFFATSCTKNEVKPVTTVENATLSIAFRSQIISMPAGLEKVSDLHASYVRQGVQTVNETAGLLTYLSVPSDAARTTTQIVASNARATAAGDFVVYSWNDTQGKNIAYQATETADSFVFEIFFMYPNQTNWLKYFHAEEKKDKSTGSLALLDIAGLMGDDRRSVRTFYSWRNTDDTFTFSIADKLTTDTDVFSINRKDNSGTMATYDDNYKEREMVWDANGAGSWKEYDRNGATLDSGKWASS